MEKPCVELAVGVGVLLPNRLGPIVFRPAIIPGAIPVNATMDSEDRFYATLFLGFGAAVMWCSRDLQTIARSL
jgi:hypothetical protein